MWRPALIVKQDPKAGETVKTKTTVTVYRQQRTGRRQSSGCGGHDREGRPEQAIEEAGFEANVTSRPARKERDDHQPGSVRRRSKAEKGSTVNLVASDGSLAKDNMPYLIGKTLSEAKSN